MPGGWGSGRPSSQPPVVDADQLLGPRPGRKSIPLIEAGQPVARDFFAHHEERLVLLTNGKFSFYLRVRWEARLHLESDLDLAILGDHLKSAEAHVQIG